MLLMSGRLMSGGLKYYLGTTENYSPPSKYQWNVIMRYYPLK